MVSQPPPAVEPASCTTSLFFAAPKAELESHDAETPIHAQEAHRGAQQRPHQRRSRRGRLPAAKASTKDGPGETLDVAAKRRRSTKGSVGGALACTAQLQPSKLSVSRLSSSRMPSSASLNVSEGAPRSQAAPRANGPGEAAKKEVSQPPPAVEPASCTTSLFFAAPKAELESHDAETPIHAQEAHRGAQQRPHQRRSRRGRLPAAKASTKDGPGETLDVAAKRRRSTKGSVGGALACTAQLQPSKPSVSRLSSSRMPSSASLNVPEGAPRSQAAPRAAGPGEAAKKEVSVCVVSEIAVS
ncbi:hypothetical protein HPB52_007689 [Rhipicephalus sanguineus]|uniref:Uncharacterized protein n=1 Tax=Rhipicephalus sanguineus TaxID=34632 RepID=A0A9D4PHX3_RHISA|nr:hypothetical protein HPB52_007689 [Rhipicephalus sanguineus]